MFTSRAIGTVEILEARLYPLDARCNRNQDAATVIVESGVYELREGPMHSRFWIMKGKLNTGGWSAFGDGLFSFTTSVEKSDIDVVFPSRFFGPSAWEQFVADPVSIEGHPQQQLRIMEGVSVADD